jgi:hypothetical protein
VVSEKTISAIMSRLSDDLSVRAAQFFQALCHATLLLAFQRQSSDELAGRLRVAVETQALAAKQVSDKLYEDVQQLGPLGGQLLEVTNCSK